MTAHQPAPRSGAVSAQYGVRCPSCGAEPFQPCRARTTSRVTDTHTPRLVANEDRADSGQEPKEREVVDLAAALRASVEAAKQRREASIQKRMEEGR